MPELLSVRTPLCAPWKSYTFHLKRGTLEGVDLYDLDVRSPEALPTKGR